MNNALMFGGNGMPLAYNQYLGMYAGNYKIGVGHANPPALDLVLTKSNLYADLAAATGATATVIIKY